LLQALAAQIFEFLVELEAVSNLMLWGVVSYILIKSRRIDDRLIDLIEELRRDLLNKRKK
jgi:hypothetical protein